MKIRGRESEPSSIVQLLLLNPFANQKQRNWCFSRCSLLKNSNLFVKDLDELKPLIDSSTISASGPRADHATVCAGFQSSGEHRQKAAEWSDAKVTQIPADSNFFYQADFSGDQIPVFFSFPPRGGDFTTGRGIWALSIVISWSGDTRGGMAASWCGEWLIACFREIFPEKLLRVERGNHSKHSSSVDIGDLNA